MNIAVTDEGGNIVAHIRMDDAWIGSIDISMKKAYTFIMMSQWPDTNRR
jgi:uncharacterized protein GlcG (DUF336 family)